MRASVLYEPNLARGCSIGDQVFAEEPDSQGWTVRDDLVGEQKRQPVVPDDFPARGAGSHACERDVVQVCQHLDSLIGGEPFSLVVLISRAYFAFISRATRQVLHIKEPATLTIRS